LFSLRLAPELLADVRDVTMSLMLEMLRIGMLMLSQ
jgi:hypothetical protein